jgi:hypothetical protein
MDHDLLGPAIREGLQKGGQEGERNMLRRQLGKRFGPLPNWPKERPAKHSTNELE